MEFKFDLQNPNLLVIYDDNKFITRIAIPPKSTPRCDIYDFDKQFEKGLYNYNFNGIIIITTETERLIYQNGILKTKTLL